MIQLKIKVLQPYNEKNYPNLVNFQYVVENLYVMHDIRILDSNSI
jgi:hypothetical protein